MRAEPVTRGREVTAPFSAKCDVVIIGSGAGGAVVARELSLAGHSVIVLEEGGYYTPAEYGAMTPSNSLRRLAREAGFAAAVAVGETPFISLMSGKCVGGSSVLTGGVCFRIPDPVLHEWSTELGLTDLSPEKLDPYFSEVERAIQVETVPETMRSRSTELFVEGADKLGIKMKSLRRNTHGCKGASRCNFGCPNGAKMSVDISYLPDALANGTHILADALVQKIEILGGRATGVFGKFLDQVTGEPKVPFYVRAKAVVVSCGSLHTPVLLRKSGLDSRHIGRHLTLHPAFRVCGIFDEYVGGWDGALQSVYSDDFQSEGITLVSAYSAASILAAGFPGSGKEHYRIAAELPRLGVFGGMIHDEGMGQVRRWISREPLISYRMHERDALRMFKGIQILGKMAFAAGAREVLLPLFGSEPITRESDLDALTERPPSVRRFECMSFHPLGSAKMSITSEQGVVKPSGETWAVDNLFVADGSVLPTSIHVNSQLPVMAMSLRIAKQIAADFSRISRRAA